MAGALPATRARCGTASGGLIGAIDSLSGRRGRTRVEAATVLAGAASGTPVSAFREKGRQSCLQVAELSDAPCHRLQVPGQDPMIFGMPTWAGLIRDLEESAYLFQTQVQKPSLANEPKQCEVRVSIETIAAGPGIVVMATRLWDQADLFIMADCFDRQAGGCSCVTDRIGFVMRFRFHRNQYRTSC